MKNKSKNFEMPAIESVTVRLEKGFAQSAVTPPPTPEDADIVFEGNFNRESFNF